MRNYIKYVTRHICHIPVSAEISWYSLWSRSMMLWSLHNKNTRLISRGIIFDVLRYLISIPQRHGHILSILRHLQYQWPWISLRGHL